MKKKFVNFTNLRKIGFGGCVDFPGNDLLVVV